MYQAEIQTYILQTVIQKMIIPVLFLLLLMLHELILDLLAFVVLLSLKYLKKQLSIIRN